MRLHVVTSCTNRKRVPIPAAASIRSVEERRLCERARAWTELLGGENLAHHPVSQVYGGEHWTEFLSLLDHDSEVTGLRGWVISAGYGLLSATASITGYSATFASGRPDSVRPSGAEWTHRDWWHTLTSRSVRGSDEAQTIHEIAVCASESDQILCAASYSYLDAVQDDLIAAAEEFPAEGHVLVLSARVPRRLRDSTRISSPEYDSRLLRVLGGSRVGLNIRVARDVLETFDGGAIGLHAEGHLGALMSTTPPARVFDRRPAGDPEITQFIADRLIESPQASATGLLRRWRKQGRACEQGRFRSLFERVREGGTKHISRADASVVPAERQT